MPPPLDNTDANILLEPAPFTRDDWLEAVQPYAPGGGDVFSLENSEAVIVGYIPFAKRWSFIRYVLGTAFVAADDFNDYSTYFLSRTPPLEHPWFGWMQAHSVHLQYFAPDGTELKINAFDPDLSFDFANYIEVMATIRFRQLPWVWAADNEIDFEFERMCFDPDRTGNLDILSQAAGEQLTFAETSPAAGLVKAGPPAGTKFPTEIGLPIYKEQFNFKWMYVPKDYIMSSVDVDSTLVFFDIGFSAKKITPRLGTLNDASFLGFAAGTLLLAGVTYERFMWPLRSVDDAPYGYNVTFHFQSFDPVKGKVNFPLGASPFRGHNLQPWRDNGRFYYATYDGTLTGQPFLNSSSFPQLFTYVDAP
jgi:hypothetical protein